MESRCGNCVLQSWHTMSCHLFMQLNHMVGACGTPEPGQMLICVLTAPPPPLSPCAVPVWRFDHHVCASHSKLYRRILAR